MARSHYVMDLFYPTGDASGRLRREVLRIEAENDDVALAEGQRIDSWLKTQFYQIRAIHNSSRAGDKVIYSSQVAETPEAATDTAGDHLEPAGSILLGGGEDRSAVADPNRSGATAEPLAAAAPRTAKA